MTLAPPVSDSLVETVARLQACYAGVCCSKSQKQRGQFFTPPSVARLMSSMLIDLPSSIRLLDPGSGAGMLSAAVAERVALLRSPRHLEVHAYENDKTVLPLLEQVLAQARDHLRAHGHTMDFVIHAGDFILDGPSPLNGSLFGSERFDVAILNPPYLKIGKNSRYALAMPDLVHGQPNLYALFMALATESLRPGGHLVAITPRSFCNGPYFQSFRRWFLSHVNIERFHLFGSRKSTFSEAAVLQESLITHARRAEQQHNTIRLTHSEGRDTKESLQSLMLDARLVIHGREQIVRLPGSDQVAAIVRAVDSWPQRFADVGLCVSTGPVVLFRARKFVHRAHESNESIPLLSVQNVRPFRTVWPVENPSKTLVFDVTDESRKLLVPTANYVLLRRFSAKEDPRRLVASPLFAGSFGGADFALENHLNYVFNTGRALSRDETMGIAAVFNSRLLDTYFRTISGNTQVNAAEVRALPFPDLPALARLGRAVRRADTESAAAIEDVVLDAMRINGTIRSYLTQGQN